MTAVEAAPLDGAGDGLTTTPNGRAREPTAEVPTANVVVTGFTPAARPARRWPVFVALGSVLAIGGGAMLAASSRSGVAVPSTSASASVPEFATSSTPLPASASSSPLLPQSSASTVAVPSASTPKVAPHSTNKPKATCDPPYTILPNGTKRYRPECL